MKRRHKLWRGATSTPPLTLLFFGLRIPTSGLRWHQRMSWGAPNTRNAKCVCACALNRVAPLCAAQKHRNHAVVLSAPPQRWRRHHCPPAEMHCGTSFSPKDQRGSCGGERPAVTVITQSEQLKEQRVTWKEKGRGCGGRSEKSCWWPCLMSPVTCRTTCPCCVDPHR